MDGFIRADIFFVVTTISVLLITIVLLVLLIYLIKFLHELRQFVAHIREESDRFPQKLMTLLAGFFFQKRGEKKKSTTK